MFTDSSVCNFLSSCYEESYLNAPGSRPSHGRSSRYSCMYPIQMGRSVMAVDRISHVVALRGYQSTASNGLLVGRNTLDSGHRWPLYALGQVSLYYSLPQPPTPGSENKMVSVDRDSGKNRTALLSQTAARTRTTRSVWIRPTGARWPTALTPPGVPV